MTITEFNNLDGMRATYKGTPIYYADNTMLGWDMVCPETEPPKKVTFNTSDSITITADKYWLDDSYFCINDTSMNSVTNVLTSITNKINELEKQKEETGMNFGVMNNSDKIHMSAYGLCVKNKAGHWVGFNCAEFSLVDVDNFHFDCSKMMYIVPVAIKDVVVGDIIYHNESPVFVNQVFDNSFKVIDPVDGTLKEILPTKNMLGFNYVSKIVTLMDMMGKSPVGGATNENPFGNMLPLMCMSGKDFDMKTFALMTMLSEKKNIDPMALLMMGSK